METGLITPDELRELDTALRVDGVTLAAHEPRGGYADPTATAVGFLRAAEALGARFERRRVTGIVERGGEVRGVYTDEGTVETRTVVLAAGAWSVPIAGSVGLELPIQPARVRVALFERPYSLPTHLTLIDTVEGFYARPASSVPPWSAAGQVWSGSTTLTNRTRLQIRLSSRRRPGWLAGAYRPSKEHRIVRGAPACWT